MVDFVVELLSRYLGLGLIMITFALACAFKKGVENELQLLLDCKTSECKVKQIVSWIELGDSTPLSNLSS